MIDQDTLRSVADKAELMEVHIQAASTTASMVYAMRQRHQQLVDALNSAAQELHRYQVAVEFNGAMCSGDIDQAVANLIT